MLKTMTVRTTIAAFLASLSLCAHAMADSPRQIDVPAGELVTALETLAKQSDIDLVFPAEQLKGIHTRGVSGTFTTVDAVKKLLEGTALRLRMDESTGAMLISLPTAPRPKSSALIAEDSSLRLARADDTSQQGSDAAVTPDSRDKKIEVLSEVVVTGTHLTSTESASPVFVFTREDFRKSGASTTQAFLATLPQNFGGSHSADTAFAGIPGTEPDRSFGTAVNLRGLGAGATLVLIDGKRSAVAGSAEYVDISLIPLSAVERIEIVTDGASAVYGSDAVAGVINFIMRKDFTGAETQAHVSTTTRGGGDTYDLAQNLGKGWGSGNAWLSYSYHKENTITASQRSFSSGVDGPLALTPEQKSSLLSFSARQELSSRIELAGSASYSKRDLGIFSYDIPGTDAQNQSASTSEEYGASVSLTMQLPAEWRGELTGGASRNKNSVQNFAPSLADFLGTQLYDSSYDLWYVDVSATGTLLRMPSGPIKMALGGSFRQESYGFQDTATLFPAAPVDAGDYDVSGVFSEIEVPLLGPPADGSASSSRVVVTLAGRFDSYSNFGDTFNPKYGVRWTPVSGMKLRATYGTSFKAPTLYQLSGFNRRLLLQDVGGSRSLLSVGNSPDLHEETAKTWNFGFDLTPAVVPGLTAQFSYFDVKYDGRIQAPGVATTTLLNDPSFASLRLRRGDIPDAAFDALVSRALSGQDGRVGGCLPPFRSPSGVCLEPVGNILAILDSSLRNVASTHTQGFDLTAKYEFRIGTARWTLDANSAYLLEYKRRLTDLAPELEFANTVLFPARLRARAGATREQGRWSAGVFANYTGSYLDNVSVPHTDIASWFTVDLNVRYAIPRNDGWLSGVALDLNAVNLFDRDPPYFGGQSIFMGYDPANADPYGRIVSLTLVKSW